MAFGQNNEEEDDLWDAVEAMANRMGLQGKERQAYIHDHMTQGGYEQAQTRESYVKVQQQEDPSQGGGASRWGFGGGARQQQQRPNQGQGNRDDGDRF
jgi:hypothetical protein